MRFIMKRKEKRICKNSYCISKCNTMLLCIALRLFFIPLKYKIH